MKEPELCEFEARIQTPCIYHNIIFSVQLSGFFSRMILFFYPRIHGFETLPTDCRSGRGGTSVTWGAWFTREYLRNRTMQRILAASIHTSRQVPIPVTYKNECIREPLFLDILVEKEVIIEVKATGRDFPSYHAQLLTQLRFSGLKSGVLINFGKSDVREGILHLCNPLFPRGDLSVRG